MESTLKEEILDKFLQLSESISIIEDRCKNIQNVDDFLLSPWGNDCFGCLHYANTGNRRNN